MFAYQQFNINSVNLNFYSTNQLGVTFFNNAFQSFLGTVYEDVVSISATGGLIITFAGNSISFDSNGNVTGGTVNYIQESHPVLGLLYQADGISVPALAVDAAIQSPSNADDLALIADGFSGDDMMEMSAFDDVINGFDGNDTIKGKAGNDTLNGNKGNDTLQGGSGKDILSGGDGMDMIFGGNGKDTLRGDDGADHIEGGDGDDAIFGDQGKDTLNGGDGDDTIKGGKGNDVITDGSGNDDVKGGDGNDTIHNSGGTDSFDGGKGVDTLVTDIGPDSGTNIAPRSIEVGFNTVLGTHGRLNSAVGQDTIKNIENFTLIGDFNATVVGGSEKNVFITDLGDDDISGGKGNDFIKSGGGDDVIRGGQGSDDLLAGNGDDQVFGNKGADKLFVSKGNDEYSGGDGADNFIFNTATHFVGRSDTNTILDFEKGADIIDLSGVDANTNTGADNAFNFIGSTGFSGTAGELRVQQKASGDWFVNGDVDGDGNRDFQIKIDDFGGILDASDFVL